MPQQWAIAQEGAGTQKFRTASGQELEDAGGIKLKGKAESGKTVLMNMRLTEVHKSLASAHRALRQHVAFLTSEGGVLFPKDSLPGRELERYAKRALVQAPKAGDTTLPRKRRVQLVRAHAEEELPVAHLDFAFFSAGADNDGERITMVVLFDSKTWSVGAIALPHKGGEKHTTDSVVEFLQLLGHRRLVLKSDWEPAILALKNQVRAAPADVEIIPQESPPGDHRAAGVAENTVKRVKGLVRTLTLSLHARLGCKLPHQHPLHYWFPEFAATCLNRYSFGDDGKTAEQLYGQVEAGTGQR
eukprot:1813365-Amphidinium_carterae.2